MLATECPHAGAASPVVAHGATELSSAGGNRGQEVVSSPQPRRTLFEWAPVAPQAPGTRPVRWHRFARPGSPRPRSFPGVRPFPADKLRAWPSLRPAERSRLNPGTTAGGRAQGSYSEFGRSPPGWCPPSLRAAPNPRPLREGRGHSPGRGWAAAEGPRTSTQPASSPLKLPPRCLRCLFVPSRA